MADPNPAPTGDDVLTAYIDNELDADARRALESALTKDAALKARLDALSGGNRAYKDAFQPLLDAAPRDRLAAMLREIVPPAEEAAPRRVWLTAAGLMLFAAGVALGFSARQAPPPTQIAEQAPAASSAPAPNWRQVVAEYLVLTTPATLAALPDNPTLPNAVAGFSGKLQLDLSTDKLMLPMTALKDVRLFDYRGRPLVQAAYLSSDAMAVAFCIILNGAPDAPIAVEQREGQTIVFWSMGGHGFMVVGKEPQQQLEALAQNLKARFS